VKDNSLYIMDMSILKKLVAMAGTTGGDREGRTWEEWHRAMGHIAPQSLKTMVEQGRVDGMKIIPSPFNFECEACIQGKSTVQPVPRESNTKYQEIGELVVTDLWGPAQVIGKGGTNYFISFMDVATRFSVVDFLKGKSDALEAYKQFELRLWTQYNCQIKCI
jgi:hypothetical protein